MDVVNKKAGMQHARIQECWKSIFRCSQRDSCNPFSIGKLDTGQGTTGKLCFSRKEILAHKCPIQISERGIYVFKNGGFVF